MKVKTLGNKSNPAIVMIPGMFCTSDMPKVVAKYLEDDFYMILPTLDGHHKEQPVYHSKEEDGREIVRWLHDNGIDHLSMIQGTSMGAEVALETARQIDLPVDSYFFDGGPFFHFPRLFRAFMAGKFVKFTEMMRGKEKEEAIDALFQSRFIKRLGENSLDSYRNLMDGFWQVCQWIDKGSVRRIADTCYQCDLPEMEEETIRKFVFLYSENEPARKAEKRLKKAYPDARYVVVKGYGHGGLQGQEPEKYAKYMKKLARGEDGGDT